jgi:hypothetical protein
MVLITYSFCGCDPSEQYVIRAAVGDVAVAQQQNSSKNELIRM